MARIKYQGLIILVSHLLCSPRRNQSKVAQVQEHTTFETLSVLDKEKLPDCSAGGVCRTAQIFDMSLSVVKGKMMHNTSSNALTFCAF